MATFALHRTVLDPLAAEMVRLAGLGFTFVLLGGPHRKFRITADVRHCIAQSHVAEKNMTASACASEGTQFETQEGTAGPGWPRPAALIQLVGKGLRQFRPANSTLRETICSGKSKELALPKVGTTISVDVM